MFRNLWNSSFEYAHRCRIGSVRKIFSLIKRTVVKTINNKLKYITVGFPTLPMLRVSPLVLSSSFLVSIFNRRFNGTYSSFQLFDNYGMITSEVINKTLVNQLVSITQEVLDKLKDIPGVKFDLPLNDETTRAFIALVGKPVKGFLFYEK